MKKMKKSVLERRVKELEQLLRRSDAEYTRAVNLLAARASELHLKIDEVARLEGKISLIIKTFEALNEAIEPALTKLYDGR